MEGGREHGERGRGKAGGIEGGVKKRRSKRKGRREKRTRSRRDQGGESDEMVEGAEKHAREVKALCTFEA